MDFANKCRRRHQSNVTGSSLVVVVALLFGTLINASPAFVGVHRPTMSETTPSSSTPTPTTTSSTAESSSAGIWRRMPSSTFLTLEAAEAERILANRDRKLSFKLESGADYTDSREMLAGETSQPFSSPTHRKPNTDTTAALASLATLNAQSALTSLTSPTAAQVESDAAAIEVAANEDSPGVSTNCEAQCRVPFQIDTNTQCVQIDECRQCWSRCNRRMHEAQRPQASVVTMVKQEFLVATRIGWPQTSPGTADNCYVTWEVAGGGLVGHMLTDTAVAELSLWPDTRYRVIVVCKLNKSGKLVRSRTLFVDTSNAMSMKPDPPSSSEQQQYDDDASAAASPSGSAFLPTFNLENRILKGSESSDNQRPIHSDTIDQQQQNANAPDRDYIDGPEIVRAPSDEFRNPGLAAALIFLVCLMYTWMDLYHNGPLCTIIVWTHAKCCQTTAERKLMAINDEADLRSSSESVVVSTAASSQTAQLQYVAFANAASTTAANQR